MHKYEDDFWHYLFVDYYGQQLKHQYENMDKKEKKWFTQI